MKRTKYTGGAPYTIMNRTKYTVVFSYESVGCITKNQICRRMACNRTLDTGLLSNPDPPLTAPRKV